MRIFGREILTAPTVVPDDGEIQLVKRFLVLLFKQRSKNLWSTADPQL
jgi:hypothetical protein